MRRIGLNDILMKADALHFAEKRHLGTSGLGNSGLHSNLGSWANMVRSGHVQISAVRALGKVLKSAKARKNVVIYGLCHSHGSRPSESARTEMPFIGGS